MRKILKAIVNYYKASHEHRLQIKLFLGFIVIPVIVFTCLYIFVMKFWL